MKYRLVDDVGFVSAPLKILEPNKRRYREDYLTMFLHGAKYLAQANLSQVQYKVLFALLYFGRYDNEIIIDRRAIAELTNLHGEQVSRSVSHLIKLGILIEAGKLGSSRVVHLHPDIGWRGHVYDFERYRGKLEELVPRAKR